MLNVVAALIISNNQFLLAQRIKGELKDFWEFPGGKVEKNESMQEAIIREVKEELGSEVDIVNRVSTFNYKYPFATIKLTLFHCRIKSSTKDLIIGDSHNKIAWVDYNESNLELAPLDKKIFDYLKKNYVI
jgi:8-oxo-dGTP diphosphatase